MKISKLHFQNSLPTHFDFENSLLLFDSVLQKKYGTWIRRFRFRLGVKSGEQLKDLSKFPQRMSKILEICEPISRQDLCIVAFGGGSIGDFAGFVASTLRRGVKFAQIPSTWLAAMDSAHGGKTALNVGPFKNQIGSFYPASDIFLVAQVLREQPSNLVRQSAGEYYKTIFLERSWNRRPVAFEELTPENLWKDLPKIIRAKWSVVKKDPYETKGVREILNLGHTVGHVLESALKIPHGSAVHFGLLFSLQWSKQKGIYSGEIPFDLLPKSATFISVLRRVPNPKKWLLRDKKIGKRGKIRFVFLRKAGYPLVKEVDLSELLSEWKRQSR